MRLNSLDLTSRTGPDSNPGRCSPMMMMIVDYCLPCCRYRQRMDELLDDDDFHSAEKRPRLSEVPQLHHVTSVSYLLNFVKIG